MLLAISSAQYLRDRLSTKQTRVLISNICASVYLHISIFCAKRNELLLSLGVCLRWSILPGSDERCSPFEIWKVNTIYNAVF
jgi:hypothetical protein